jgi:hypothetical protein
VILVLLLAVQGFAERTIATLPEKATILDVLLTPDGAVAYAVAEETRAYVVHGGRRTGDMRLAMPAALSSDGLQFLYVACGDDIHELRLNERVLQRFDVRGGETFRTYGALSRDAQVAVLAVGDRREGWWAYSVNGKTGAKHKLTHLTAPEMSADGKTIAGRGTMEGDTLRVIHNDVAGPIFDDLAGPVVSANGVMAYVGEKADGSAVLHVGGRDTAFEGVIPSELFISTDGAKLGFVIAHNGFFVKVGTKTFRSARKIARACFDSSGRQVLYYGFEADQASWLAVDERLFPAPGMLGRPAFNADGSKVGYIARAGRDLLFKVIDLSK